MNSAYKLFITTKNKNWKHTHSVTFPLTHKGLFDAEDLFKSMKEEPSLQKLMLFRCDSNGRMHLLKQYEREEKK